MGVRFVDRNRNNKIIAHYSCPQYEGQESLEDTCPEIVKFDMARSKKQKDSRDARLDKLEEQINEIYTKLKALDK